VLFNPKAPEPPDEDLITAQIGIHTVTIKDLTSLGPGKWMNDVVIDRMTDLLASKSAKYNATKGIDRKVAVFDSRFTSLIIESPNNSDPTCCNYSRIRGFGSR
jgi:hypothetical protein